VKAVGLEPVPRVVATETATMPGAWAGVVAVTLVGDVTWTAVAVVEPNMTVVVPVRWVPVMVTLVPPVVDPVVGVTDVTAGPGVTKVKAVGLEPVPCVVLTETVTLPGAWAGVVAVTFVGDVTCTDVAVVKPNVTVVVPVRCTPVMITLVPPVVDPEVGVTVVTVGAGVTYVKAVGFEPVPCVVLTETVTLPGAWAGVVAVTFVGDVIVNPVAVVEPNVTAVVPVR
jgi:hypothetical protein